MKVVIEYPSSERLIVILAKCLFLNCEVDLIWLCALPLVRGCIVGERSCVLPNCICPKFSAEVPCVGSPVWSS